MKQRTFRLNYFLKRMFFLFPNSTLLLTTIKAQTINDYMLFESNFPSPSRQSHGKHFNSRFSSRLTCSQSKKSFAFMPRHFTYFACL
jgi:hypothetical protein